jgi:hypothetical protein
MKITQNLIGAFTITVDAELSKSTGLWHGSYQIEKNGNKWISAALPELLPSQQDAKRNALAQARAYIENFADLPPDSSLQVDE